MTFSPEQINELIDVLAAEVPVGLLLDIRDPYVPLPVDDWRKRNLGDQDGGRASLARLVVETYQTRQAIPRLAKDLYRKLYRDPVLARRLILFTVDPARQNSRQQAALSWRSRSMSFKASRLFWNDAAPRICAIVAQEFETVRLGTGFLVAPDLIVTAFHTLSHLIDNGQQGPGTAEKYAVFDFYEGDQIPGLPSRNTERWVPFADHWLVDSSKDLDWDGRVSHPDPDQIQMLEENLDFVLVRLAASVGLETITDNGGRRRNWFELPSVFPKMQPGQRISIPQHPHGFPQDIDFGFFVEECPSKTRLRSDIETGPGTSGAPCFAISGTTFPLVGMHNAEYAPAVVGAVANPPAVLNQAVYFAPIASRIKPKLSGVIPNDVVPLWSTTVDTPTPILGRNRLIDWVQNAASPTPQSTCFAAVGVGKKIGRSFSAEILRALTRDTNDRVIEFGARGGAMPATIPDLVRALFDQLALPLSHLVGIPARPDANITDAPDKLHRWASVDVPRWLLAELADNRRRTSAEDDPGQPPDGVGGSGVVAPIAVDQAMPSSRWDRIWIALRLEQQDLVRSDIMDFLAGLVRLPAEDATLEESAPLRWLFLGNLPDFASNIPSEFREALNPLSISVEDGIGTARAIAQSQGKTLSDDHIETIEVFLNALIERPDFTNAETRLMAFQDLMKTLVPHIRERIR